MGHKIVKIKVIPRAKQEKITEISEDELRVYVNAPAVCGKANKAVIEALASYFNIKKLDVTIIKGQKLREKIVKIVWVNSKN